MSSHLFLHKNPPPATTAGQHVRHLRRQAGLSQLDLALMAGVSQRHLSCVETGRAKASTSTLHAILMAQDVAPGFNLLETLLCPGGLGEQLL